MDEWIITANDLGASGQLIQMIFALEYPDGMRLGDMLTSGIGWLERAAIRFKERTNESLSEH